MGGRIAVRFQQHGFDPLGFDLERTRAGLLGLNRADSVAEVAEKSDVIFLSLPDSRAVEATVRGSGGLLESCRDGQVIVDLSTAAPSSTRELAGELDAIGVKLVDAAVSGGAAAAEKGQLTIMAGGDEAALERARPAIESASAKIVHLGSAGAGHATKVLNNFLNAVTLAATAEVMVGAKIADLDLHKVLEVINGSSGSSFASEKRFPSIIKGDYLEGGLSSKLMMKDVTLYVDMMREIGAPSVNSSGPLSAFGLAIGLGYGDEISNKVVDAIGDVAGGVRLHEDD